MGNYINWSNVTDFSNFPEQANVVSGGSFWVGMLYMMWVILIILFSYYGFEVAIVTASFLALMLGLPLVYFGLVAFHWIGVFIGILLIMFLYIIWSSSKSQQQ